MEVIHDLFCVFVDKVQSCDDTKDDKGQHQVQYGVLALQENHSQHEGNGDAEQSYVEEVVQQSLAGDALVLKVLMLIVLV